MSDTCGKSQEQGLSSSLEKPFVQQSLMKSDIFGLYLLFFHLHSFYRNDGLSLGGSQLAIASEQASYEYHCKSQDQRLDLAYRYSLRQNFWLLLNGYDSRHIASVNSVFYAGHVDPQRVSNLRHGSFFDAEMQFFLSINKPQSWPPSNSILFFFHFSHQI